MDAVTLLRNDHKTVEALFKKFEKAGPNAHKTKQDLVEKIVEELSIHAAIEEQVLYPAAREAVPDATDEVLEALEEHHIVKWVLSELDGMDPTDERFTAKVTVLIENVRHHVKEEEGELFPELRKAIKRKDLEELAQALEKAKKAAPTHPHPRAPDTPPGNVIVGVAAAAVDKAEDTGKKTVRKVFGRSRGRERKAG
ncbi:MAG TPA: hemerythrin domain-containing protein [Acidimicrobiales bacterium]|jgi:hemerythrin superfamily protein|nr:hemerythrin domain-containing protein [Acidimicrobiales bacterium]